MNESFIRRVASSHFSFALHLFDLFELFQMGFKHDCVCVLLMVWTRCFSNLGTLVVLIYYLKVLKNVFWGYTRKTKIPTESHYGKPQTRLEELTVQRNTNSDDS